MKELPIDNFEDNSLLSWAIFYMHEHGLQWHVCKFDKKKHTFSFISCPTFDVRYEPVVGDSCVFKARNMPPKWVHGGTTVYHQKHLFVDEINYDGFDVEESRRRTEILESIP